LTHYIQSIELGRKTKVALMMNNSDTLVGMDGGTDKEMLKIWMEQRKKLASSLQQKKETQEVDIVSVNVEDKRAFVTFEHSSKFPVMVSLIMHEEDILRGYYTNRYYYFIFLGVFIGFTITIGVFSIVLVGQIRRAQLSEQNALLASQAKSDFLAKISHELRTPLNAIIGFSEMLEAEYFGKLAVDQRERIHDIHECGSHLLALINDLLDFSKAEAGKLVLNEENIYLGDVISEALRMVSPQASHAGVTIIDQTATCLPTLRADARKLKQVLVNLLSNSIKFTPKRGNITVSTMITKRGDLQIMVQDTGIGMDENQIPKAFSLFEQVHNDSGQGTGLGLSLCKMLVELHDGRIGMRSKKGEGTSVFFLIPKKRLTDPALNKRGFFS
jgi:signal transduction histidine kinase